MDEVFVYLTHLPHNVKEVVLPCYEGYTIYIDENLDEPAQMKAYSHAMRHIHYDFDKSNVQSIEAEAHI
jgi:hypothetical protein